MSAGLNAGPFKKRKAFGDAEFEDVSGEDTSAAFSGYSSLHGIDFDTAGVRTQSVNGRRLI